MKIVAISGSMRKGNTLKMIEAASSAFEKEDITVINLAEMNLCFCTGCLRCDEEKKCYIEDDMEKYMDIISAADGYILASPVRWSLISGELKTFFDRLNPFAMTGELGGKKAILFVVGQSEENSEDSFSIDAGLKSLEFFCENAGIDVIETVKAYGCYDYNDINESAFLAECINAANKLKEVLSE